MPNTNLKAVMLLVIAFFQEKLEENPTSALYAFISASVERILNLLEEHIDLEAIQVPDVAKYFDTISPTEVIRLVIDNLIPALLSAVVLAAENTATDTTNRVRKIMSTISLKMFEIQIELLRNQMVAYNNMIIASESANKLNDLAAAARAGKGQDEPENQDKGQHGAIGEDAPTAPEDAKPKEDAPGTEEVVEENAEKGQDGDQTDAPGDEPMDSAPAAE